GLEVRADPLQAAVLLHGSHPFRGHERRPAWAGREKAARRRLLGKSIMRLALDNHLQAPGADEPLVSLSALDGPCVDFNSPPIRRGVYETELCLRIVDPLDEQAAVCHTLRVVGDEYDVAGLHFVWRDHNHIVPPQFVLGRITNDRAADSQSQIVDNLTVGPNNKPRAVKTDRWVLPAMHVWGALDRQSHSQCAGCHAVAYRRLLGCAQDATSS